MIPMEWDKEKMNELVENEGQALATVPIWQKEQDTGTKGAGCPEPQDEHRSQVRSNVDEEAQACRLAADSVLHPSPTGRLQLLICIQPWSPCSDRGAAWKEFRRNPESTQDGNCPRYPRQKLSSECRDSVGTYSGETQPYMKLCGC